MPGIDYRRLRALIPMEQVLELIGFEPTVRRGEQLRGGCPLPNCQAPRMFSVNVERGIFRCYACGARGNQLDLWSAFHNLPLHQAAQHLCQQSNILIPWFALKH